MTNQIKYDIIDTEREVNIMRIIKSEKILEKRKIKTAKIGEAFCCNDNWYASINIGNDGIYNFGEFCENHFIKEMPLPTEFSNPYPAIHLISQSFCYLNGELEADEWATLEAKLTPII